jgi:hypothetical protein
MSFCFVAVLAFTLSRFLAFPSLPVFSLFRRFLLSRFSVASCFLAFRRFLLSRFPVASCFLAFPCLPASPTSGMDRHSAQFLAF